jgi:hypothetical protein
VQSTYIRATRLLERMGPPAWMTLSLNPRRSGTVVAIDGPETWLIHNHLNRADETFESVDRDASIRAILGVDGDFQYEVLSKEDWVGRRLVADRFRNGRTFICGDAAHLWMPYAGYGMNAGVADAANLAWLIGAVFGGWGAPSILDAYAAERQPITEQVSHLAMEMALKILGQRRAVPADIEAQGPRAMRCALASGGRRTISTCSSIAAAGSTLATSMTARRSLSTTAPHSPLTICPNSRSRQCRAAARRIFGSPMGIHRGTRWARATPSCDATVRWQRNGWRLQPVRTVSL